MIARCQRCLPLQSWNCKIGSLMSVVYRQTLIVTRRLLSITDGSPQEWQFSRPPQKNKSKNLVKMFFFHETIFGFGLSLREWSSILNYSFYRLLAEPFLDSAICNNASSTVSETISAYWCTASRSKRIAVIDMHNRGIATSLTIEEEKETCFQIRGGIWNFHLIQLMLSSRMQSM